MKCIITTLLTLGVIFSVCDQTNATPLSRAKRQGWAWGGNDSDEGPSRPALPTTPQVPPTSGNEAPPQDANESTTSIAPVAFARCISTCRTTQQYNPVCGTNRVTYDNEAKLKCAKACGADVTKMFNGTCQPVTR